jgi:outer membrane protein assembly factor BamB
MTFTRGWVLAILGLYVVASGCQPAAPRPSAALDYVYPPRLPPWLSVAPQHRIGRGQAAAVLQPMGVISEQRWEPLGAPMIWQVPVADGDGDGDGVALAVVAGSDSIGAAVELLDIDAGLVRWRVRDPVGAVVGVTAQAIVGAGRGTWALDLEGATRWQTESPFVAMAGSLVVVGVGEGNVALLSAETGRELRRVTLPAPRQASDVRWACDANRDLLLIDDRSQLHLVRAAHDHVQVGELVWTAESAIAFAEGCGDTILASTASAADGRYDVLVLSRRTGRELTRISGVHGHWLEPDGSISIAGADGLRRWNAELTRSRLLTAAVLGNKLTAWRGQLIVRAGQGLALVDSRGQVHLLAASADSAALGDRALLTSVWSRSRAHAVVRAAIGEGVLGVPVPAFWQRDPRPVLPPADLISVSDPVAISAVRPLAMAGVGEPGLTVGAGASVVTALRSDSGSAVVRLSLDGKVLWSVPQGCGDDTPTTLAVSADLVLCAGAAASGRGPVVARELTTGELRWQRDLIVDRLEVLGQVVLVLGADRASLLQAWDGAEIARYSSDDGATVRAALIEVGGAVLLVQREGNAVVARWPLAGMIPVWSVAVDGQVQQVHADHQGVLVVLAGGEAYAIAGRDGAPTALIGEAQRWFAIGEGLLGLTHDATPGSGTVTRLALYARHGALRWAYDVAVSGQVEVLASAAIGASALVFGESLDRVVELTGTGLGQRRQLPESSAEATWVRVLPSPGGAQWAGVSTSAPRWWVF